MPSYIDFTAHQGPANWVRHLISIGSKKREEKETRGSFHLLVEYLEGEE
jgi:hypothetical protein